MTIRTIGLDTMAKWCRGSLSPSRAVVVVLALAVGAPLAAQPPTPPSATEWVKRNAFEFADVDRSSGFADLQPLKRMIGNARIVALGEGTHGTHEFFALKRRLTEFLARDMGFTIFAMEANMPEAKLIGDYVRTGNGDPVALIRALRFWTANTAELLELVQWMRQYNAAGGTMQFAAFDMQLPAAARQSVSEFLHRADPALAVVVDSIYATVSSTIAKPLPMAARAAATHEVVRLLEAQRARLIEKTSRDSADWAIQSARVAEQGYEWRADASGLSREVSMARNVQYLLDHAPPRARIVLWAHNAHVSRDSNTFGGQIEKLYPGQMVNVALTALTGVFNAEDSAGIVGTYEMKPLPEDAIERVLASAGKPRLIVDIRKANAKDPATAWLTEPRAFRFVGIWGKAEHYATFEPSRYFDLLAYFEKTRPSKVLP